MPRPDPPNITAHDADRTCHQLDTLLLWWDNALMLDLNDIRLFERVAALRSFAAASRELGVPRSSVSRAVQRLERTLGIRLLQRTTRTVTLTEAGTALFGGAARSLAGLDDTLSDVGRFAGRPRGKLRISTGIGFGVNVLSELLPVFLRQHPEVEATLDLDGESADLVADQVDVAIRMGALPDSRIVARRLGTLDRYLCASPDYLAQRGTPVEIEALRKHDLVDLHVRDGRPSVWVFTRGDRSVEHEQVARLFSNCALTIHRMLVNGAGIGLSTAYLCAPEIEAGRLVRVLPDWDVPAVPVHAVFPSQRQLAPVVRAFVDFMVEQSSAGQQWQTDALKAR